MLSLNLRCVAWALAALFAGGGEAVAGTLTNYSVFVLGSMTTGPSEYEGSVVVGGVATLTGAVVGSLLPPGGISLVVGGDLHATGGLVNGTTMAAGATYLEGGWTTTALAPPGTPLPLDFVAEAIRLGELSSLIAAQPTLGSGSQTAATLTLTAGGAGIHVFDIDQATLASISTLRIVGPPEATVLINMSGVAASLSYKGMSLSGGISEQRVLLNFHTATTLQMAGMGLLGSVLAPHADVAATSGVVFGDLIAGKFTAPSNAMRVNALPFLGELPETPVPEPATWVSLWVGLGALSVWRRRGR